MLATFVLLFEPVESEVRDEVLQAVSEERLRVSGPVLTQLYASCAPAAKPWVAASTAVSRLPPKWFMPLFDDAYRRSKDPGVQATLLGSLHYFLRTYPAHAVRYRALIRALLRSRNQRLCVRGLGLAGQIDDLQPEDLALIQKKLLARSADHRMSALAGLADLMYRHERLAPHVREFCRSEPLRTLIRKLQRHDDDPFVRWGAWNCFLAWRVAFAPQSVKPGERTREYVPRELRKYVVQRPS